MIRVERDLCEGRARELLRRIRDLSLGPCGIDLRADERVQLRGCVSLDHPVERGVRYAIERADGRVEVLALSFRDGRLEVCTAPYDLAARAPENGLEIALHGDRFGRVTAPGLGARIDLEVHEPRELEHFLRRVVRAALDRSRPGPVPEAR